jgi:23S rRNA G2445 N2-methylase RlmL
LRLECFATTIMGLEDIAARECGGIIGAEARPDIGKIFFEADEDGIIRLNLASRTIHRIFVLLSRSRVEVLDDVYRAAREVDYVEFIRADQAFAVKGERHSKDKPFTSIDMAAAVGRAVIESFREKTDVRLRVNLDNPDVQLYCLIRDSELLIGLDTTGKSLHRRYYRVYHHRAALQPSIAASMLMLSGWRREEALLDPMCGSGTIPIEAALMALRIPPGARRIGELALNKLKFIEKERIKEIAEELEAEADLEFKPRIIGSDASPKSIRGAVANVEAAGVLSAVRLVVGDVLKLGEWLDEKPSHVFVNPPYGIRMGVRRVEGFYRGVCASIRGAAPDAKLTAIVSKPMIFGRALESAGYIIDSRRQIMYGRLNVSIIMATPR